MRQARWRRLTDGSEYDDVRRLWEAFWTCEGNCPEVKCVKGGSFYSPREMHSLPVNIEGGSTSSGALEYEDYLPHTIGADDVWNTV